MEFNLVAPLGFRGLDAETPLNVYHRNLPHWRQDGATYFVTFNLADALPAVKKNELVSMRREWEFRFPPPRDEATRTDYAKAVFRKVEKWMDAGYGKCWFRNKRYADELNRIILHFHEQRYEIGCSVIMANQCHMVIRPFESFDLEDEVGSMKNISAIHINKYESLGGALWQQESYDRIIRDEEHLWRVVQYIGANPGRAGVPLDLWYRWVNPVWRACGWDFQDGLK